MTSSRVTRVITEVLPAPIRARLNRTLGRLRPDRPSFFGRSRLLSVLYYSLSGRFGREMYAVMLGRRNYESDTRSIRESQYRLRRNTHRIEKGLISRPRRAYFAVGYISETVEAFERVLEGNHRAIALHSELNWAHDVLKTYFAVNAPHPVIDQSKERFEICLSDVRESVGPPKLIPYRRPVRQPPPIDYEAMKALATRRRSVRWFDQRSVPRELIDKALTVAGLSPSACNRQPFTFRIYDDPAAVERVASIPGGTAGFYQNFPAIAVIVGELRAFFSERDRHLIYIDGALATMSFMFALETLGLSSCPINWPDVKSKDTEMRSVLGLDADELPVMLVAFGYPDPDGLIPFSQKKPLDQLRSFNRLR